MTITLPQLVTFAPPSSPGVHRTDIEWCDYALGAIVRFRHRVSGRVQNWCIKKSAGCNNCYAEAITVHWGGLPYTAKSAEFLHAFVDEGNLEHMLTFRPKPAKGQTTFKGGRSRPTVFCGDMTDPAGEWITDEVLDRMFAVFAVRPDVDWLVLTKRPERLADYLGALLKAGDAKDIREYLVFSLREDEQLRAWKSGSWDAFRWPLPNVWLGFSAENQDQLDKRLPDIFRCPAAVRFISYEPAIGPVDFHDCFYRPRLGPDDPYKRLQSIIPIHWLIVGGESGTGARPYERAWGRFARDQCAAAGVAFFYKQEGSNPRRGMLGPGEPIKLSDAKGGDLNELPEDLRIRELPR